MCVWVCSFRGQWGPVKQYGMSAGCGCSGFALTGDTDQSFTEPRTRRCASLSGVLLQRMREEHCAAHLIGASCAGFKEAGCRTNAERFPLNPTSGPECVVICAQNRAFTPNGSCLIDGADENLQTHYSYCVRRSVHRATGMAVVSFIPVCVAFGTRGMGCWVSFAERVFLPLSPCVCIAYACLCGILRVCLHMGAFVGLDMGAAADNTVPQCEVLENERPCFRPL